MAALAALGTGLVLRPSAEDLPAPTSGRPAAAAVESIGSAPGPEPDRVGVSLAGEHRPVLAAAAGLPTPAMPLVKGAVPVPSRDTTAIGHRLRQLAAVPYRSVPFEVWDRDAGLPIRNFRFAVAVEGVPATWVGVTGRPLATARLPEGWPVELRIEAPGCLPVVLSAPATPGDGSPLRVELVRRS